MSDFGIRLRAPAATLAIALALGISACGDDESSSTTTVTETSADTSAETDTETSADAPSLDTVLSCLQDAGLDAEDQSSSTGDKVGIDYPAGRTVISFEESEEDAEIAEGVAESDPTYETFREGLVVVTIPDDPEATGDRSAIETCVSS